MGSSYEREKLGNAVRILATSSSTMQQRLIHAGMAMHTLIVHRLSDPDRQLAFTELWDRMTADNSDPSRGALQVTCSAFTDEEAEQVAQAIVQLQSELLSDYEHEMTEQLRRAQRP